MSKIPPIRGVVIDRGTLDLIHELQDELAIFHGIRHLWANAAANGTSYIATKDDLYAEQTNRLWTVTYMALCLHEHAFPGKKAPHRGYARIQKRPADVPPDSNRSVIVYVGTDDDGDWCVGRFDPSTGQWSAEAEGVVTLWFDFPKPEV